MDKSTAMNLLKNTFVDYPLIDGSEVKLTLAFALLKMLEDKDSSLANRYYKVTSKKEHEMRELDIVTMLYTAYSCACIADNSEPMDEDTFTILLGSDRLPLKRVFNQLMGAKKNPASASHS